MWETIFLFVILALGFFFVGYMVGWDRSADNVVLNDHTNIEHPEETKKENPFKVGQLYRDEDSTIIVTEADEDVVKYNFIEIGGIKIENPTEWWDHRKDLKNFKPIS